MRNLSHCSEPMFDLPAGHVDLWLTHTDRVDPSLAARYRTLLTPQELAQHARFHFEKDRHRHLVARALAREALSRYLPVAPREWRFEADRHGKPHIARPAGLAKPLAFNISHTEGLVAVAVCVANAIGVDVEFTRRRASIEVAERFFSAAENRSLQRLSPQARERRFWDLWTLKESYVKARGLGLAIPLDQCVFDLDSPNGISLDFAPGFDDLPSRWQFRQMRPSAQHRLALCVEVRSLDAAAAAPIRLTVREATPLLGHRVIHCPVDRCSGPADAIAPEAA